MESRYQLLHEVSCGWFYIPADAYFSRKPEFPQQPDAPPEKYGYDLHENDEIVYEGKDEFMTDLLTRFAFLKVMSYPHVFTVEKQEM